MRSSDALGVQVTMEQFAQVCDQLALGFFGKCEPHGWREIHWSPPLGYDDPVTA
jgi:hypothetical protein